jgi:hypothetical protein
VRVSRQVLEYLLGVVAKRSFDVGHSFLVDRLVQELLELVLVLQRAKLTVK